jgi:hypothetical protein
MKNFINLLIGFGLIGLVIYGVFKSIAWFFSQVLSVDPRISAALITGLIAIIGTSLTITIPRYFQKKMEIESHLRDKKSDTYKLLVELLFKILMNGKTDKPLKDKDIIREMSKFTENLILWGSEDVMKSYISYRKYFMSRKAGEEMTLEAIEKMENLLLVIRKDMGHKNKNLQQGDILSLFINDIDEVLAKLKAS